ncbi:endolysin; inhibits RNA polymerase [Ralstonia phage phiAp1]|uniref:dATP/dGTP diphosphohydrolase N-terminal domain-containing protein n=1 Tax=Ralstonia phage phiAp1 TaxID=2783867 RepID=A0A1L7DS50_9CAUD|nr:endolysin; inhibits RNA polymerase [Ralstonia phage phiAp1]APU03168.1 hypothetical protein phiAp1_27 [Ralstonia phage phiAp1]
MTDAFKHGDKIRYLGDEPRWDKLTVGNVYTFHSYHGEGTYGRKYLKLVEFMDVDPGHNQLANKFELVCDPFAGEPLSPIGALDNRPPANPKQAFGDKKPPVHLVHGIALLAESQALHAGRRKYGENNFIQTPVEAMTYVAGMKRHIDQWVAGEEFDPVELVSHLGAVRAGAGILLTAAACGMMIDNRPVVGNSGLGVSPKLSYKEAYNAAFERAQDVIEHLNKLYPAKLV